MEFDSVRYRTIVADPPWQQKMMGKRRRSHDPYTRQKLDYPTMTLDEIQALPLAELAESGAHLWLWTTNQFLRAGFEVMEAWGFKYLAPITWVKPSGVGNYFVHRTQTVLFGYREHCRFPAARYLPTVFNAANPAVHSTKPEQFFDLVERISPDPRIELFARQRRAGWDAWGNEVENSLDWAA